MGNDIANFPNTDNTRNMTVLLLLMLLLLWKYPYPRYALPL